MNGNPALRAKLGGFLGLAVAVLVLFYGFKNIGQDGTDRARAPSSLKSESLIQWAHQLSSDYAREPLSEQNCISVLDRTTEEVLRTEPSRFPLKDVQSQAEDAIRELFRFRMALLDQARPILSKGIGSQPCALRLRRTLRNLRGVEDYIGAIGYLAKNHVHHEEAPVARPAGYTEMLQDNTRVAPRPIGFIEVPFPSPGKLATPSFVPITMLMNPSLKVPPGVRSGDILISRGNSAASALIARMADEDTQFSHMALIYIDQKSKKAWTIEAHIEYGSIVTPLKEWLSDGKSRTMIYRYPDSAVAHRAAERMFNRVAPRYRAGNAIEYDFPFDMHDHSKLFCSEVVREGYEYATDGKIEIPLFPSKLTMASRDLMDRLGISQTESFIPADIELDSRFSVIGEWRNFKNLPDVWQKDAVLTSVYAWLERDKYHFDSNLWLETKASLAKGLRSVGMIRDLMPNYMSHDVVVLNFMLDTMTVELQERIASIDARRRARTGFPMTYYEIMGELERMKKSEGPGGEGPFRYLHPD